MVGGIRILFLAYAHKTIVSLPGRLRLLASLPVPQTSCPLSYQYNFLLNRTHWNLNQLQNQLQHKRNSLSRGSEMHKGTEQKEWWVRDNAFPSLSSTTQRYGCPHSCCLPSPHVQARAQAIPSYCSSDSRDFPVFFINNFFKHS